MKAKQQAQISILAALMDEKLFRPFIEDEEGSVKSWGAWFTALRCLYGLQISPRHHQIIREATGETLTLCTREGFQTALFLCPRHSGKSKKLQP